MSRWCDTERYFIQNFPRLLLPLLKVFWVSNLCQIIKTGWISQSTFHSDSVFFKCIINIRERKKTLDKMNLSPHYTIHTTDSNLNLQNGFLWPDSVFSHLIILAFAPPKWSIPVVSFFIIFFYGTLLFLIHPQNSLLISLFSCRIRGNY